MKNNQISLIIKKSNFTKIKNKSEILLIFIFSILIMVMDIPNGYIKGHDTDFHFPAITAMVEQLSWENLMVREPLKYIGNNFGYGTRFFYPPLPHLTATYITKILTTFNINNVAIGMRITQWLTILLSGITFYFLGKKIFKNKKIAVLLSLFYMSAPYHLSQIFVRDSFSEMFIPIAIPLIVLGLLYLTEKNYKMFFYCFISGYTIGIYSHLAMIIFFTLMILATFFVIYFREIFFKKSILYLILASIIILLLTASFWMPMLEIKIKGSYGIFMPYYITEKGGLANSVISIKELLAFKRKVDFHFIRYNLQLFVTIMFLASLIYIIKKKMWKEKRVIFLLAFTILSITMVTSIFPWKYTPDILQTLQFPWRISLYIAFGTILITGICLKQIESKKYFNVIYCMLIVLTLIGAYINIDHLEEKQIDLTDLNNAKCMGNQSEYLPEKAIKNREYFDNRTNEIILLEGSGKITTITDDVPNLEFRVDTTESIIVELPRIYYMGYKLTINEEEIQLQESKNGFIQATINDNGIYKLTYIGTNIMKFADLISFSTFLTLAIVVTIYNYKNSIKKINN